MSTTARVSQRVSSIDKSAIHEMTRLSRQVDDVAFLSWARPTSATPEHIGRAAIAAIEAGSTGGYSESAGLPALRDAIVAKLRRDNGIEAEPSQVLVTVGAIEGLAAAVLAAVDPGDEVILPSPTYSTHIRLVRIASAKPVMVPTAEKQGFRLDLDAMRAAITPRTRAILFCTPSNPTGTVFPESQLRELAALCVEHDLLAITDEAYEYFVFDDNRHFSIGSLPEMRDRTVSCFTFTKTYAMTGWRVGYLHASDELVTQIAKAHIPLAICAPVVSQYAALAALQGSQQCVSDFARHYRKTRDLMCERLDRLGSVFEYQRPGGSYLMFPRILVEDGQDSTAFCRKLLFEARVSTTPGVAFGPTGQEHLRMSFCVSEDEINKAFDRLEKHFGGQGG
ncbi:aminotransferase class I/II-fold pyridoxal phosphate-dependent enzyme [candidate division WOR-3 bacterium]|nr:aminotransferase class I/II-fold pyridoxal phosphate-dependent enzyme [candidate division WOR-3 bacterium]